jgi:dolichol kinase
MRISLGVEQKSVRGIIAMATASFRAVFNFLPAFFPFFTPSHRSTAGNAKLGGKVGFDSLTRHS